MMFFRLLEGCLVGNDRFPVMFCKTACRKWFEHIAFHCKRPSKSRKKSCDSSPLFGLMARWLPWHPSAKAEEAKHIYINSRSTAMGGCYLYVVEPTCRHGMRGLAALGIIRVCQIICETFLAPFVCFACVACTCGLSIKEHAWMRTEEKSDAYFEPVLAWKPKERPGKCLKFIARWHQCTHLLLERSWM